MGRWAEIRELTRTRIVLFLREPEAVFWVFAFPVILAVVLGFAFSEDEIEPSPVGIVKGVASDALAKSLDADEALEVKRFDDETEARRALTKGVIDALVVNGQPPEIRCDPARAEGALARLRVLEAWRASLPDNDVPSMREVDERDTGTRYLDFLFPGLLGMNLMGTGIWSIGFAVADIRQKKLLKRMLVTPMRRSSFLLSFILSRKVFMVRGND